MKLKASYHAGHNKLVQSQRAEHRATLGMMNLQATKSHMGRKQSNFAAPLKSQPRSATGGYIGKSPFADFKVK